MTIGRLLISVLVIGAVGFALVAAADLWLFPWLVHQQGEVLVPDLVGLSEPDAEKQLDALGLRFLAGEESFDETIPIGTVLEQSPPPLRSVRRGRPVRVVLSAGAPRTRVPDLGGLTLRQAELELGRAGLRLGRVARTYDPDGPLGVVGQRPYPADDIARRTTVNVLVREGRERSWHRMPRLTGRGLSRVRDELARAGFEIKRVTYRPESDALPGTVLEQSPGPGTRIPTGGSIELVAASRN